MEVKKIPKKTVTLIEPKRSVLVDKEKYHQKRVAAYCRVSTDSEGAAHVLCESEEVLHGHDRQEH